MAAKPKREYLFTPPGVFSFPKLNKPDEKYGGYSVKVRIPPEFADELRPKLQAVADQARVDTKEMLEERLENAKTGAEKGKAKKALADLSVGELPLRPTYGDDGEEDGGFEISAKMADSFKDKKTGEPKPMRPDIVDAEGKQIKNPPQIWGGTVGRVKFYIAPYYVASSGQCGASLKLVAVQIIDLKTGSGGDHGFGKADGGYVHEDDDLPKASGGDAGDDAGGGDDEDDEF